jgi:hypothetical protein
MRNSAKSNRRWRSLGKGIPRRRTDLERRVGTLLDMKRQINERMLKALRTLVMATFTRMSSVISNTVNLPDLLLDGRRHHHEIRCAAHPSALYCFRAETGCARGLKRLRRLQSRYAQPDDTISARFSCDSGMQWALCASFLPHRTISAITMQSESSAELGGHNCGC